MAVKDRWAQARNILVVRLDNIGDVVITSPALRALKMNLPEARVTLLASPAGAQAAPLLPWVDDVLVWRAVWQDLGTLELDPVREWELINLLRERHLDAAIIFTSFKQTPHAAGYVCYLAGIPLRLGQSKEWGGRVLTDEVVSGPDEMHQAERNLRLVESLGLEVADRRLQICVPRAAEEGAAARLAEHGLPLGAPYLLLSPWASCPARTYFPGRFAAAARGLAEATGWPVVLVGAQRERRHSGAVLKAMGSQAIDLVGETGVPELAALIARAQLVLTNDSLPMHLADAVGAPSVILYSGTEYESQWKPRSSRFRLLRRPTVCSPCYAFECPYHMECLDISPDEVVAAGLELVGDKRLAQSGV